MSASESKSGTKSGLRRGGDSSQMDLSMLRAQFRLLLPHLWIRH